MLRTIPGLGYVVVNEQQSGGSADTTSMTVRAVHLYVNDLNLDGDNVPLADIILGEAHSSATFVP